MLQKQEMVKLYVSVILLVCFIVVAFSRTDFSVLNLKINLWAASVNSGPFTQVAIGISYSFDTLSFLAISIGTAAVFLVKKHWRYGLLLLGAMGGDTVLVSISKALIMSPRPSNEVLPSTDFSFPSGHVTGAVVFFGIITYYIWRHRSSITAKTASVTFYLGVTSLVGFDRVYLNVHWLSDVIGSVFLGGSWLLFCIFLFEIAHSTLSIHRENQLARGDLQKGIFTMKESSSSI